MSFLAQHDLAWHYARFTLPEDWECTGYTCRQKDGRIELSNPEGFIAQYNWRNVKAVPDIKRIMNTVYQRHLEDNDCPEKKDFKDLHFSELSGFTVGYGHENLPFYAGRFIESNSTLIEWVFPSWSKKFMKLILPDLLASFQENYDDVRYWSAFGLPHYIPKEYQLEHVDAQPANVSFHYETKKHHRLIVRRWGLTDEHLRDHTLKQFYGLFLVDSKMTLDAIDEFDFHDRPAVRASFQDRGRFGLDKLIAKWWRGEATAFFNADEKRIYSVEQIAPKRKFKEWSADNVFFFKK